MRLVAAAVTAVATYLAVGYATGYAPALPWRRGPRRRAQRRQSWLLQAGLRLTPTQFWAGCAAVGLTTFVVLVILTATIVVAVVPALATAFLPAVYFARQRSRRLREVADAWPDGLREMVASIAVGMSLPQALTALAHSGPEPLQRAFARFPLLARMLGVVPALEVVKAELADPTSDRVIEVLILAHERGGRIVSDVLRDLADATAEDAKTLEQIATDALEQKLNARVVFVLPWLVLLLLTARPGHFRDFYQSEGGIVVVAIAALASLLGVWLIGRLGRDPVEERVLAGAPLGDIR